MPLPLTNLDTRRWTDLVEEGQSLISRYAPAWTDHNIHDPGITLMELLAWLTEREIYRVNRVPERHRRKFLALAGFRPEPPQPATAIIGFSLSGVASVDVPTGLTVQATLADGRAIPFQLNRAATIVPTAIVAIQQFDGRAFRDLTGPWRDGLPLLPFGADPTSVTDPTEQQALYIGLDGPLPAGTASFYFWLEEKRAAERTLLLNELTALAAGCAPREPAPSPCTNEAESETPAEATTTAASAMLHHEVRLVWEYFAGPDWQPLTVVDESRAWTLSGAVHVQSPVGMSPSALGDVADPHHYLRVRLAEGRPDAAPELISLGINFVQATQRATPATTFTVAAGVMPTPAPQPGARQPLHFQLDASGVITTLTTGAGPETLVLAYQAATATTTGELTLDRWPLGPGNGRPEQRFQLPAAPIAGGQVRFWGDTTNESWQVVADFDASGRSDRHLVINPSSGEVLAGNGETGQVLPAGGRLLAEYHYTQAEAGNVARAANWSLLGAADEWNEALLGRPVADLAAELSQMHNPLPATGGAPAERLTAAAGRLAATLWAHERLVELVPNGYETTLDQLDRELVMNRQAPQRATTLLDIERLALGVPGSCIARARAWAGLDARYPCYAAPGTVSLIILPELPAGRPTPTPGLLSLVRAYLSRRRILGMRLVVVGPQYVTVRVEAEVRARSGADTARVGRDIAAALNLFLDPLTGGPSSRGYPFGRDIYYAEMMQVIDDVSGVDHVLSLTLFADGGAGQCGNLCIGPINLPAPGDHQITVKSATE